MTQSLKKLLENELSEIRQARDVLELSYKRCRIVILEPGLDNETLERFEALTARFARLSDITIQKVMRTLDALDLEDRGTIRDRINRAEKRGVIESADVFVEIRMLRNEIAHEYRAETIFEIYNRALELTPVLIKAVDNIQLYAKRYRA